MEWNGTYIGQLKKQNILQKFKFQREIYWQVYLPNDNFLESKDSLESSESAFTFFCLAKSSKTTLPCILDEFKPLFNLNKIGTHWCKIGTRIYILYQTKNATNLEIEVEPKLRDILKEDKNFLVNHDLIDEIKRIYAFREIFGITFSTHTSLRIRSFTNFQPKESDKISLKNEIEILSFREPNINPEKSTVSKTILKDIFNKDYSEIKKYILKLLNISTSSRNGAIQAFDRGKMEDKLLPLVKAIDGTMTLYVDTWISRIVSFTN